MPELRVADASALTLAASGALLMGDAVAALFFAKFWRRTGAPVFVWFAVAFALLAFQRLLLALLAGTPWAMPWSYLLRLLAFVLILAGVVAQNRARR